MGETMKNKIIIAGALFLILGMTGAAQQDQQQFQQGEVFQNEDTRLNAVYAVDGQGDFYGMIFSDNKANFFGTVDSFNALQGDNIRVCQHYLVQSGGFLGNIFGNERTASQVKCVQFQGNISPGEGQVPMQPQQEQNQTNQNQQQNQTNESNQTDETQQDSQGLFQQQNQTQQQEQNQTQQSGQMGFADMFYAYDADGDYVTYVINNQGEISNVVGSVESVNQLSQDSLIGCEYFFQAEAIAEAEDPSEVNCYGYEELQNRADQGQIPYLNLEQSDNQTQQQNQSQQNQTNQTQNEGLFS